MTKYEQVLSGLLKLLNSVGEKECIPHVEAAIADWHETKNHRGLHESFKKEGFDELSFSSRTHEIDKKEEATVNYLFHHFHEMYKAYSSTNDTIKDRIFKDNHKQLEVSSWRCYSCGHPVWDLPTIDRIVLFMILPKISLKHYKEDKLIELSDYKHLMQLSEFKEKVEYIKSGIEKEGIEISDDVPWFKDCPNCMKKNNGVYRWILAFGDEGLSLTESKNNKIIKK